MSDLTGAQQKDGQLADGQRIDGPVAEGVPDQDGREPLTLINVRQGMFGARGDTSGYDGLVRRIEMPGATDRPYGEWFDAVVDILEELLGDRAAEAIEYVVVDRGELTLYIAREHLLEVAHAPARRPRPSL